MANPQKENGYTAIANELLEALVKIEFPKNTGQLPIKLCLFIIRKTYGYHKKMDIISLSQFQKATNDVSRGNLVYWLNYLVQAKILVRVKRNNNEVEYGFNKDYEQWLTPVQANELVQARCYTGLSHRTETSPSHRTYKRKKDNTKETTEQSSGTSGMVIDLFKNINPSYKILFKRKNQHDSASRLMELHGYEKLVKIVAFIEARRTDRFCPSIATPLQLEERWASLEKYALGLKGEINKFKVAF